MRFLERVTRTLIVVAVFALAATFAVRFGTGGLWKGLGAAHAGTAPGTASPAYDLTQLQAVNETLDTIRKKYVKPDRVKPRRMFISALDQVQKEVAPVIVWHEEGSPAVRVRVDTEEKEFRVDNVQGPWDVSARLREVFAFLQTNLKDTEVNLRDVEYAACNGMLRTLDPHSVFMSPEAFAEMNLSTSGHFGGLGIVISIRDQMLTVMRPMPDTPAGRSGLKRLDRITKINNESTLNMPLDDAVKRLRGKAGSKVTIWVQREGKGGWNGSKPFELVREEISIKSVVAKSLLPGIGYVRIKQFQQSTDDELEKALEGLKKQKPLAGLVLDLRDNPGGLLDQAARVADRFLERGVIVSTVGGSEGREEKRAKSRGTEPRYPIVVLTNASSASASEIVSGALKNHDRAVVVGQTTFGKGTVQLVFPRIAGDAALKLTIAEYLTPGDVSIQGVGVAPDIELDRMTVDALEMDLFRSEHRPSERDLTNSLVNGNSQGADRPWTTLRYNLTQAERFDIIDRGGELDDEFRLDFPIAFARDLASRLSKGPRMEQLTAVQKFLDEVQAEQMRAVSADLVKMGVDWSAAPSAAKTVLRPQDFDVSVATSRPKDTVTAGESMDLIVAVKNNGTEPIYQLRAVTKSDAGYYDDKELVFGRILPGETKKARSPLGWCQMDGWKPGSTARLMQDARRSCFLPKNAVTRQDVVKVRFSAAGAEPPLDAEIRPTILSLPKPIFAYDYQIVDDRPGNGDGQITRGEGATVYLTVKNVGKGKSHETQANLSNLTGDGLLLKAGRFDVSNLAPGDTRQVAFTFDVLESLKQNLVKLELSVADRDLGVISTEKLSIPVVSKDLAIEALTERALASRTIDVHAQPLPDARVVGEIAAGSGVDVVGRHGGFLKVALGATRFGFVRADAVERGRTVAAPVRFVSSLANSPPLVEVQSAALATRDSKIRIGGRARDGNQVLDAYIFVGSRKVFYQSNRKGTDPLEMSFSLEVDLKPGINIIHVVARESEDTAGRQTMVVRRDGPNGEALPTPTKELFGADWEFTGEP
jgi:carboxyl-terminal processing protease